MRGSAAQQRGGQDFDADDETALQLALFMSMSEPAPHGRGGHRAPPSATCAQAPLYIRVSGGLEC